jgi:hypothetical protein
VHSKSDHEGGNPWRDAAAAAAAAAAATAAAAAAFVKLTTPPPPPPPPLAGRRRVPLACPAITSPTRVVTNDTTMPIYIVCNAHVTYG